METGAPGLYVSFFIITQDTLGSLPDRGGAGDRLYSIDDALPPGWTESYPDWERTSEALREIVEGLPPTEAVLERYPDAVYTLYSTVEELASAKPASIQKASPDAAMASFCNSVVSIVNEAREQADCGLYATFEMSSAAEQGDEADEA